MTGRLGRIIASLPRAAARLGGEAARLRRGRAGLAAVEFAFILPLMLTLYFGVVVLAQGLEAGRKTHLLSRTLADLTAQTLAGTSTTGTCASTYQVDGATMSGYPCLTDNDFINTIFAASAAVLYPFANVSSMTISQIVFDNVSATDARCCRARLVWSVGAGVDPVLRSCGAVTAAASGVNSPTTIPAGLYPGGAGDAVTGGTVSATNNKVNNFIIVADVTYVYAPSFGFQPFHWNESPNGGASYTITHTTYMAPRAGSSVTQASLTPTATQRIDQGVFWTPSGGILKYNACSPGNAGNQYNLP
jgi:Flp pilus assembly protein TadG